MVTQINTTHTMTLAYHITKMASISMVISLNCKQHACGEGEVDGFGYTSVSCIEEDYRNGDRDSYKEGDDDDDGGYDYAPAA